MDYPPFSEGDRVRRNFQPEPPGTIDIVHPERFDNGQQVGLTYTVHWDDDTLSEVTHLQVAPE